MDILRAIIGIVVLIGIAYFFSGNKKKINWKLVVIGLCFQIVAGLLIMKVNIVNQVFNAISSGFVSFLGYATDGAKFLFSGLAINSYAHPGAGHSLGVIFAFQILPVIIFFSAVTSALYYLGILQKVVKGIAWLMSKTMGLSGAESLSAAGNIFLGQTEAPLLVRPFIADMTKSELNCLMTGGMATIAGSVLAAFVTMLGGDDVASQATFATYLLTASIMNAPAAIIISKILVPETEIEELNTTLEVSKDKIGVNMLDAITNGTSAGLRLAANVAAMLLAFVAIIYAMNGFLVGIVGEYTGLNEMVIASTNGQFDGFSLQYILGQLFRLLAFAIGVNWDDTLIVGSLLGQKAVINEFVAYKELSDLLKEAKASGVLVMQEKSLVIVTYALCGFSNFSSIAIQIGGIGAMAPNRQGDLSKLGLKALLGATLACMLTGAIAGAIVG